MGSTEILGTFLDPSIAEYLEIYQLQKQKCLNSDFGKTAQFWCLYLKLIDHQHQFHYAVNVNNFDLRLMMWNASLPLCFATNRIHFSPYGTFYVTLSEYLDATHPGAKDELKEVGVSVQRNNLGIGQSVDLAGEQSYMQSAKISGGVTQFAAKQETVAKWVMNRAFQSKFVESLKDIAGLSSTMENPRKCL